MKRKLYLILSLFLGLMAQAQNNISVASFRLAETDLTAITHGTEVKDQNGNTCALIKVETTQTGFSFDVGMMGIMKTEQHTGEMWVYVPFGVKRITIQHQQLGTLRDYYFPCSIEQGKTYIMQLTTGTVETIVKETVQQQYLVFQVTPADAALEVNDQIWPVSAEGTARKFVNFDTYDYRVQAPNYHPEVGKVTVNDPNNKKIMKVDLKPNFGWIEVSGTGLQGATVYVDNALIGKAPCKSEALKSGQHSVKIAKELYETFTQMVTVTDNETTKISPSLTADFSNVTLAVDADAEIWVNDELKGTRRWTGNLSTGTYKIECKMASHETSLTTKEITNGMNGKTISLNAPRPIYGSLNIESSPDFCDIYLDGKKVGETPMFVSELLIGRHEVKISKANYADYTETVTIAKGETKVVDVVLAIKRKGVELACVMQNGKYGFIDKSGKLVVPCVYDFACAFSEGLALVRQNYKWGYIDKSGKLVIPCVYHWARKFSEGLAGVEMNEKWGYIDKSGKLVIPCVYDGTFGFSEGLVCVEQNGKGKYVDGSGDWVIPYAFDFEGDKYYGYHDCPFVFSEGLALVNQNYKFGYIDKSGNLVIPCVYDFACAFSEGLAGVTIDGKCGFIDKSGSLVIPCVYNYADAFSDGLACVRMNNGKWGYIDKSGNLVISCVYDDAGAFSEGLAGVTIDGKCGFIDKSGSLVIPCVYDDAGVFSGGLTRVRMNERWGYIDKSGELMIPCVYDWAGFFSE